MTTKCKKSIIENMVKSKKETVLAGRYLASQCRADLSKERYGDRKDFYSMQCFFDREYPNTYYLMAYKKMNSTCYEKFYNGSRENKTAIRIFLLLDAKNPKEYDYFGFLGSNRDLSVWSENVLKEVVIP